MSSTIQLPEDDLIQLLLELKASNVLFLLYRVQLQLSARRELPRTRQRQSSTPNHRLPMPWSSSWSILASSISQYFRSHPSLFCIRPMSDFILLQQTLATFAPQQNGLQPPSMSAVPPHFQAHSSRGGTPQFATPPPTGYPIGAPRTGPGGYPPSYIGGTGATSVPGGPYSAPPPPQTTNQTISAALAAIPENQRVSSQFDV